MGVGRTPRAYQFRGVFVVLHPPEKGRREERLPSVALVRLSEVDGTMPSLEVAGYLISFEDRKRLGF